MAKAAYAGIGGVARKVKSVYAGVGGVARRVKRGYVGIGGVARPFLAFAEMAYYGKIEALSQGRSGPARAVAGGYAIFGGGTSTSGAVTPSRIYDAYTSSLVKTSVSTDNLFRYSHTAASVGGYALFAGGYRDTSEYSQVTAYSPSLVMTSAGSLQSARRTREGGATAAAHAIFAGQGSKVDAYSASLVRTSLAALGGTCFEACAAKAGGYALVCISNYVEEYKRTVYCYNADLVRSTVELSGDCSTYASAASNGQHALIAYGAVDTVNAFSQSLVRSEAKLSAAKWMMSGASAPGLAVFVGGRTGSAPTVTHYLAEAFDANLTRKPAVAMSNAGGTALAIGGYVLSAGGTNSSGITNEVEVLVVK